VYDLQISYLKTFTSLIARLTLGSQTDLVKALGFENKKKAVSEEILVHNPRAGHLVSSEAEKFNRTLAFPYK